MKAPLRPDVVAPAEKINKQYTIRQAINWYKEVYNNVQLNQPIAEQEGEYINNKFGEVIRRTNPQYGLPEGPLGQFVASVAIMELARELTNKALADE
jgi:hypothetical protein